MRVHRTAHPVSVLLGRSLICLACLAGTLSIAPSVSARLDAAVSSSKLAAPAEAASEVKLRDESVFSLRASHASQTASERATDASRALLGAAKRQSREVTVETVGDTAVIYAGGTPIVQLREEDARAAGDPSLSVHVASTATKIRDALEAEYTRAQLANRVFSVSLVVFLGLLTLYVLKRSGAFERRMRAYLAEHPERIGALKVNDFELLGRGATRLVVFGCLGAAKWLLRGAVLYGYLAFLLTLFVPSSDFSEPLARWVVTPAASVLGRLIATLPVLVGVLIAGTLVWLLLRLNRLFFSSISLGETKAEWLERDSAEALGRMVGIAIVGATLIFAAPVVTGESTGAFANLGTHLLLALALAAAPLLASAGLGAIIVLRRHVKLGDHVALERFSGVVRHFGLLELVLSDVRGDEVRVPYLRALLTPLKVCERGRVRVSVSVAPSASASQTLTLLRRNLVSFGDQTTVRLVSLGTRGIRYELSTLAEDQDVAERLLLTASEALERAGIPLTNASATTPERIP